MVFRANSRGFTDVWLGSSDRLRLALLEHDTWAGKLGNTDVAKGVDPKYLFRMGKLV
jgi:hypothetical protein